MKQLLLLFSLLPLLSQAQSVSPELVSTSGDYFAASSTTLSWSLGEISIETYTGSSNQLSQGFHQPEDQLARLTEQDLGLSIQAFPNPFTDYLTVLVPNNESNIGISAYDVVGNLLFTKNYTGTSTLNLDFSDLSSGIYMIEFKSKEGLLKTIKVQKL